SWKRSPVREVLRGGGRHLVTGGGVAEKEPGPAGAPGRVPDTSLRALRSGRRRRGEGGPSGRCSGEVPGTSLRTRRNGRRPRGEGNQSEEVPDTSLRAPLTGSDASSTRRPSAPRDSRPRRTRRSIAPAGPKNTTTRGATLGHRGSGRGASRSASF